MTIARLHQHFTRTLLTFSVVSLIACGGGGGDNSPAPDTTPDAITFSALSNAEPNAVVASAPITISGINTAAPIVIVGGEYAIAGAAFTAAAGTISNGQTLVVRTTASDKTNTPKVTTITVGGVSATFTVTTLPDVTPDAFSFAPQTNAALNTEYTSAAITVSGIDVAVPVSITGGSYSINGGTFTQAAGTASAGQTISVKTTTGGATDTTHNAVLTVGGVTGTFAVSTVKDTTPPVAEFKFPTPYTMSEANQVKVRGTATDDNAITHVKVVVRSFNLDTPGTTLSTTEIDAIPKAETNGVKDFSSWTADIPLTALAENEIKVIATDDKNNVIPLNTAEKVVIRQADGFVSFPNEDNPFDLLSAGIVLDNYSGRNRLLVADGNSGKIHGVALNTGVREIFIDLENHGISGVWGMVIDDSVDEPMLYANEYSKSNILKFNLSNAEIVNSYTSELNRESHNLLIDEKNGIKSLISVNQGELGRNSNVISFNFDTEEFSLISSDADHPVLPSTRGFALDKARDRYLVTVRKRTENLYGIYSISRTTGERKAFSTNEVGSGELFVDRTQLQEIAIDEQRNILYVPDYLTGKLFSIDLITGNRKVLVDLTYRDVNGEPLRIRLTSIYAVFEDQYVFISDGERNSLLVVDLTTGEKVVLTKSRIIY
jgi:hypothetical protein